MAEPLASVGQWGLRRLKILSSTRILSRTQIPVVMPPSSRPTQLAADSNVTPKTRKTISSSSIEAISPEVGESNQQVKQPQPEANAKSSSGKPAKMDAKAEVMNTDLPKS